MNRKFLDQPSTQILEYWRIARHRAWWIYLCTVALALASFVVIALLPDIYQATTTILVDPQKIPDQYVTATVRSSLTDRLQTISQEVLSGSRLQEIIDQWHLYPQMRQSYAREEIIDYMRKSVKIEVKNASGNGPGTFSITYQGKNPTVVAGVANQLASSFIEWNLKSREQQAVGTTEFLAAQLEQAKQNLQQQETKLREFKMKYLGEMPDQLPTNFQALSRLQISLQANADALNRLDQERILLMRVPEVEVRPGIPPAPTSERTRLEMEKRQLEGQLWELRKRYTPGHPDVAEATARLERVLEQLKTLPLPSTEPPPTPEMSVTSVRLEIIKREMKRLNDEQKLIQTQIAAYQAKVDAAPIREQQITEVTRDYEMSKAHYQSLLDKAFSAEMASDLERKQKAERFTILDPARAPERPAKPNRPLLMGASAVFAFFFSFGLAVVKEKLDTTIKSEGELKEVLPASVHLLASIPTIDTPVDRRRRLRFAVLLLSASLLATVAVAGFLWKVHPIL